MSLLLFLTIILKKCTYVLHQKILLCLSWCKNVFFFTKHTLIKAIKDLLSKYIAMQALWIGPKNPNPQETKQYLTRTQVPLSCSWFRSRRSPEQRLAHNRWQPPTPPKRPIPPRAGFRQKTSNQSKLHGYISLGDSGPISPTRNKAKTSKSWVILWWITFWQIYYKWCSLLEFMPCPGIVKSGHWLNFTNSAQGEKFKKLGHFVMNNVWTNILKTV